LIYISVLNINTLYLIYQDLIFFQKHFKLKTFESSSYSDFFNTILLNASMEHKTLAPTHEAFLRSAVLKILTFYLLGVIILISLPKRWHKLLVILMPPVITILVNISHLISSSNCKILLNILLCNEFSSSCNSSFRTDDTCSGD